MSSRCTFKKKILRENLIPYICRCGNKGEWQGKTLTLELHHKNGQSEDHRIENVEFLCPNCHSQEPTTNVNNQKSSKKIDYNIVLDLYNSGISINEILIKLEINQSSYSYYRIKKILRENNIEFRKRYKNKFTKIYDEKRRKVLWPSKEELQLFLVDHSFVAAGKKYGVSDNAVRKWCRFYKIL